VVGLTGPGAGRVRETLKEAGLDMTTLHVDQAHLRQAVASEPSIASLRATPDFPHGLRIDVTENHPVAAITIPGSGKVPIAGNGTLMPGDRGAQGVPELRVQGIPRVGRDGVAAARLKDDRVAPLVRIASAAPPALLQRATSIEIHRGEGIVVLLRDGPRVIFGDASSVGAKWLAAAGVLASPDSQGAAYVDVRLPDRPVAGGLKAQTGPGGVPGPAAAPAPQPAPSTPSTPAGGSPQPAAPAAPATPATAQPQPAPVTPHAPPANTQP
jgi:cell division septal protein FtsQ